MLGVIGHASKQGVGEQTAADGRSQEKCSVLSSESYN